MKGNAKGLENIVGKVKEILKIDTSLTKSGYAADAKVVGDKIAEIGTDRLGAEDIVNDLESEAEDKPLSAAMGKVLRQLIGNSGGGSSVASDVSYDNSESGLDANDVQRAITLLTSMARNALPLEGGTMTGENIYMDNGRARIQGDEDAMWMWSSSGENDDNNRRGIAVFNPAYLTPLKDALRIVDVTNGEMWVYPIYGGHNKKWGSFSSPVEEGEYRINTNSEGHCVMLYGVDSTSSVVAALVCAYGAITVKNNFVEAAYNTLRFENGVIVINHPHFTDTKGHYNYFVL
jgi:hypothetical protein